MQAERAGVLDERPKGRDAVCRGSVHASRPPKAARHYRRSSSTKMKEMEMTNDELRKVERTKRKALWALASIPLGDPHASELIATLDDFDYQERNDAPSMDKPLDLDEVRNSVPVHHHQCGIDIVLERDIPQPWRERFLQASIGSTRVTDGPYATDWDKFLACWETEMQHLEAHRAACSKPKLD